MMPKTLRVIARNPCTAEEPLNGFSAMAPGLASERRGSLIFEVAIEEGGKTMEAEWELDRIRQL